MYSYCTCIEYGCTRTVYVLSMDVLVLYMYWVWMYSYCTSIEYGCTRTVHVLSMDVLVLYMY